MKNRLRPLTFAVLRRLADGEYHSGEVLGKELNVSRASISNALAEAGEIGLTVYSIRGRGYRLVNTPQWLDSGKVLLLLGPGSRGYTLQIQDMAESSNTLLLQQASKGAPHGSVLAVEWQTGGRGRLGRTWHSGLGDSLTFSILWRFDCGLSGLSGLSLAAGIAVIRALKRLGLSEVALKWPNDIYAMGRKLAGILVEAQGDMLGPSAVVVGIGLNFRLSDSSFKQIDQPASDLAQLGRGNMPERNALFAMLLDELASIYGEFGRNGFSALRQEWESYHLYQNQAIRLVLPDGQEVHGVARGVNAEGALCVEIKSSNDVAGETRLFHAGEISLRGTECC